LTSARTVIVAVLALVLAMANERDSEHNAGFR
jgi:hypothetical protein